MTVKIGKSAKLFQERRGLRPTLQGPGPQWSPASNAVHELPVAAPLPPPELLGETNGAPPPDQGHTRVWPFGQESIS